MGIFQCVTIIISLVGQVVCMASVHEEMIMQDKSFGQRLTTFFIRVSVLSALVSTPVLAGTAE